MRIGLVAALEDTVPPLGYGSINRVVYALAAGLQQLGHEAIVIGRPAEHGTGQVTVIDPGLAPQPGLFYDLGREWLNAAQIASSDFGFDVINWHSQYAGCGSALTTTTRSVVTFHLHDDYTGSFLQDWRRTAGASVPAVAMSAWQMSRSSAYSHSVHPALLPEVGAADHAGLPQADLPEGFVLFLGQMVPGKGLDDAFQIAAGSCRPLVMAGPVVDRGYFRDHVVPRLDRDHRYLGQIGGSVKVDVLSRAAYLLGVSHLPETFGLTLLEANLLRTPYVARRGGATGEVHRLLGYGELFDHVDEAVEAAAQSPVPMHEQTLAEVRAYFSATRLAADYVRVICDE